MEHLIYNPISKELYDNVSSYFNYDISSSDYVKWIPGFEGFYAASKDGKIWRDSLEGIRYMPYQILKRSNHLICQFDQNKFKPHTFLVARLILKTFVSPPEDKNYLVAYKDLNKHNVCLDNLYWLKYNNVLRKPAMPITLYKDGELINFKTISEARLFLKLGHTIVLRSAAENNTTIKGWNVKYA